MKRRTFLGSAALATLGVVLTRCGIATNPKESIEKLVVPAKKPVVISTWKHGIQANEAAWALLNTNGSALDAVEQGVRVTESDAENRSVGLGGNPDADGNVTLDACIMDHKSKCGSVAYLQNIEHPISVARKVMEDTPHVMLVGKAAEEFALEKGFPETNLLTEGSKQAWMEWKESKNQSKPAINHENHDTIGMLAIDEQGNLSGACTTSGWAYKLPGRVGDSPIIGAGLFVDNEVGAACATGMGEAIIRIAGSHTVVELMRQGKTPNEACKLAVERIIAKHEDLTDLQVGFLALNKNGEAGGYSTYAGFNYAYTDSEKAELIDAGYEMEW
jgi:isoaspartyl peptidase/L-asparaginase-like protein (Ntn-hydrolase superfamily)